jgi:uncharacterized protein
MDLQPTDESEQMTTDPICGERRRLNERPKLRLRTALAIVLSLLTVNHFTRNVLAQDSGEAFIEAVIANNDALVTSMLRAGISPNTLAREGASALHYAVGRGNIEIVRILLSARANVNIKDIHGDTPLDWASHPDFSTPNVRDNNNEIANTLIRAGASVNIFNAVAFGMEKEIDAYINDGGNLNVATTYGDTLLVTAINTCNLRSAEILLKHGADLRAANSYGFTALHEAAKKGCPSIAELLIKNGADINAVTENLGPLWSHLTPLIIAAGNCETAYRKPIVKGGDLSVLLLLINAKADLEIYDNAHNTALQNAKSNGCGEFAKILESNGARKSD